MAVLDSIKLLSEIISNRAIARQFDLIKDRLEEGQGIAGPLNQAKYFTPMMVSMVAIGEESGNLDEMLREVAVHYDLEVEHVMKSLTDAIGPLLTIVLAAVVGFFALAIFLPLWDIGKLVK